MNIRNSAIVLVLSIGMLTGSVSAQGRSGAIASDGSLPNPKEAVECGLALRYIDHALSKAAGNSNVIFIIRMKKSNHVRIARTRSTNIRNYLRFRRFERFEVTVDLNAIKVERVDIYVQGELLYALPLKSNDELNFLGC
jgi:hypothetical protein